MVNEKTFNRILGTKNIKFNKDSDGDGVPNHLDCQPHNPRKQGVIHDIRVKMLEAKEKRLAEREVKEERVTELKSSIRERKERIETSRTGKTTEERAAVRAGRRATAVKVGSFVFSQINKATSSVPKRVVRKRRTVKRVVRRRAAPVRRRASSSRGKRRSTTTTKKSTGFKIPTYKF